MRFLALHVESVQQDGEPRGVELRRTKIDLKLLPVGTGCDRKGKTRFPRILDEAVHAIHRAEGVLHESSVDPIGLALRLPEIQGDAILFGNASDEALFARSDERMEILGFRLHPDCAQVLDCRL